MSIWQNKPPLGSSINWGHPLSRGLVGAWLMNEGAGNKVNDLAKNNCGYINGSVSWVSNAKGKSLYFNGSDTFIQIPNKVYYDNLSEFSISYTVYYVDRGETSNSRIIDYGNTAGWCIMNSGTSASITPGFFVNYDTTDMKGQSSSSVFPSFKSWYSVVMYWDGNKDMPYHIWWYANNRVQNASSWQDGVGNRVDDSGSSLFIGGDGTGNNSFKGFIENVYLWNRKINYLEVKSIYENPYQFIYKPKRVFYSIPTGVTGWSHKIYGINNANIGKVNNITKDDIAKVNGV